MTARLAAVGAPRARVHPTAVVDAGAVLGDDTSVGAYAIVGPRVVLGAGCAVHAHAVVDGIVHAGARNVFHPFSVVGGAPQDRRYEGEDAPVLLGNDNVLREHVTVHGGTGGRTTRVGSGNLLMVGCHVAHDARVGDGCTIANAVQIAGHAVLEDHVVMGGLSAVAQFVRIGEGAFLAGGAMCERDVPPFVIAQGDRARVRALNVIGLQRRGVPQRSIAALRAAFRAVHTSKRPRAEVLAVLAASEDALVQRFAAALRNVGAARS